MYHQTLKYGLPLFIFLLFGKLSLAQNSCPLFFQSQNLCADLIWTQGPSADEESAFVVRFWDKDTGSSEGPYQTPRGSLGSFSRMTCCGSITFIPLTQIALGEYQASKVIFVPGSFEVFLQIKNQDIKEQQSVRIEIDE